MHSRLSQEIYSGQITLHLRWFKVSQAPEQLSQYLNFSNPRFHILIFSSHWSFYHQNNWFMYSISNQIMLHWSPASPPQAKPIVLTLRSSIGGAVIAQNLARSLKIMGYFLGSHWQDQPPMTGHAIAVALGELEPTLWICYQQERQPILGAPWDASPSVQPQGDLTLDLNLAKMFTMNILAGEIKRWI